MSATILSAEAAKQANIQLTEGYKGSQALSDALVAYRSNRRQGNAHSKNPSEVAGSGKKLWNQKGTGNARMGSKKLALRAALTSRILDGEVLTTTNFQIADGKTKSFIAAVNGLTTAKNVLLIGKGFDELTFRAGRNVQNVQLISADDVNAEHLLRYRSVVVTGDALETLAKRTA